METTLGVQQMFSVWPLFLLVTFFFLLDRQWILIRTTSTTQKVLTTEGADQTLNFPHKLVLS